MQYSTTCLLFCVDIYEQVLVIKLKHPNTFDFNCLSPSKFFEELLVSIWQSDLYITSGLVAKYVNVKLLNV
jgi:hypothetical protein